MCLWPFPSGFRIKKGVTSGREVWTGRIFFSSWPNFAQDAFFSSLQGTKQFCHQQQPAVSALFWDWFLSGLEVVISIQFNSWVWLKTLKQFHKFSFSHLTSIHKNWHKLQKTLLLPCNLITVSVDICPNGAISFNGYEWHFCSCLFLPMCGCKTKGLGHVTLRFCAVCLWGLCVSLDWSTPYSDQLIVFWRTV